MDTAQQFADAQEQATREWTRTQERAIGVFRDAQANFQRIFPAPSEVIETSYDFAAQALLVQKEFTLRWVDWLTPGTGYGRGGRQEKPPLTVRLRTLSREDAAG